MAEAKPKYVRLTSVERESVITAFKEPLLEAIQEKYDADKIAPGKAVYDHAYPENIRKMLPELMKHGFTSGSHSLYVYDTDGSYSSRVELGETYQTLHRSESPRVPKPLIAAVQETVKVRDEAIAEVSKLAQGLDSAARACKTRHEFGQVWPALYDLMGKEWVEAEVDQLPRSLPVVVNLDAATAAVVTIKKAA